MKSMNFLAFSTLAAPFGTTKESSQPTRPSFGMAYSTFALSLRRTRIVLPSHQKCAATSPLPMRFSMLSLE
jgi:hypothetical protein